MGEASFDRDDKFAQEGTQDIINHLTANGFIVRDVQSNRTYQKMDIDLLAFKEGRIYWIEIKCDRYSDSPNYFAETISNNKTGSLGCWYQTKSHYIFYYFPKSRELHIMDTVAAQEYVRSNEDNFRRINVKATRGYQNEVWYNSVGYLVPKKELIEAIDIEVRNI